MTRYIVPKYIFTKLQNQRAGGEGLSSSSKQILIIILAVVLFLIILIIALGYFSSNKSPNTKCSAPDGCLLLSGVMNAQFSKTILAKKIPSSSYQADYSICSWLFIKSNNF